MINKLNSITNVLIGLAFVVNLFFKDYFNIYAYGILPIIFLNSIFTIYISIKNKEYKSSKLIWSILWIIIICILIVKNIH